MIDLIQNHSGYVVNRSSSCVGSSGTIEEIEEHQMDAVTSLCGSGIAYLFLVQEAMSEGGVKVGLPRHVSDRLAVQTMLGAARMSIDTGKRPGQVRLTDQHPSNHQPKPSPHTLAAQLQ